MESREETYQPLHVVKLIPRDDNHVVRHSRGWLILFLQVLYCNSCEGLCQAFSRFVCYSSVGHDEFNAIYRIRNSGMQVLAK